jgi:hypothetical protein
MSGQKINGTSRLGGSLRAFDNPAEARHFEKRKLEIVWVGGTVVGGATYQPSWRWSPHVDQASARRDTGSSPSTSVLSEVKTAGFDDGRVVELRPTSAV